MQSDTTQVQLSIIIIIIHLLARCDLRDGLRAIVVIDGSRLNPNIILYRISYRILNEFSHFS